MEVLHLHLASLALRTGYAFAPWPLPWDERHFVFDCPHFAHICRQFRSLYRDADGTMQCFVWHKDQKAVCHCLAAILNVVDDSNKDASS